MLTKEQRRERRKLVTKEARGIHFFLKTQDRVNMTLGILRYFEARGENGVTYSEMKKAMPSTTRFMFVTQVLVPSGFVTKKLRYKKKQGIKDFYYKQTMRYYITSEGQDFIMELENKYKELKMKHLYGRVL